MPIHRIEVAMKPGLADPAGEALCARVLEDLDIRVENARVLDVFTLNASLNEQELERVRANCLPTRLSRFPP